jgi:hypothetical protein
MKKHYLLLSAAMLLAGAAHAQGTELFFSEYDEGAHQSGVNYGGTANSTGSERALEIYNPTRSTVNLNPYAIRRYSNGSAAVTEEEKLFRSNSSQVSTGANTLSSGSTFVVACGEVTLPTILAAANQFSVGHTPTSGPTVITGGGVVYFNGDDAVALVRYPSGTAGLPTPSAGVIIDIIGVIGYQPAASGSGGTGNWSGYNTADDVAGVHTYVTSANESIVRRPAISGGLRVNPAQATYNIADEWSMYSTAFNGPGGTSNPGGQSYVNLGLHTYTGPIGVYQTTLATHDSELEKLNNGISIYPNPASSTATVELKNVKVGSLTVINGLGQRIVAQPTGATQEKLTLDLSGLKPGLYFVQCLSADGQTKIFKELMVK